MFDAFPHFLIIEGPKGSGRTTLVKEICKERNIHTEECAGDIATIREIVENSKTLDYEMCYIINANDLTREAGNALLKTCEESGPLTHIVLKSSEMSSILETLISRSFLIRMDPYSNEEILDFLSSIKKDYDIKDDDIPYLINTFITPGDVRSLLLTPNKGRDMVDYAHTFLANIDVVDSAEASKILNKLEFKDDQSDRYPSDLFMRLVLKILSYTKAGSPKEAFRNRRIYMNTADALSKMNNNALNKERILLQWILKCNGSPENREEFRGGKA